MVKFVVIGDFLIGCDVELLLLLLIGRGGEAEVEVEASLAMCGLLGG
jgi:hypothetical protein